VVAYSLASPHAGVPALLGVVISLADELMRRVAYLTLLGLIWSIAFAALVDGLDRLMGGRAEGVWFIYLGGYWAGLTAIACSRKPRRRRVFRASLGDCCPRCCPAHPRPSYWLEEIPVIAAYP